MNKSKIVLFLILLGFCESCRDHNDRPFKLEEVIKVILTEVTDLDSLNGKMLYLDTLGDLELAERYLDLYEQQVEGNDRMMVDLLLETLSFEQNNYLSPKLRDYVTGIKISWDETELEELNDDFVGMIRVSQPAINKDFAYLYFSILCSELCSGAGYFVKLKRNSKEWKIEKLERLWYN